MAFQAFDVFRLPDSDLLASLREIVKETQGISWTQFNFELGDSGSGGGTKGVALENLNSDPFVAEVAKSKSTIVRHMTAVGSGFSVAVARQIGFDKATVTFPNAPAESNISLLENVHKHLRAYSRTAATDEILGKEIAEFYRQREDLLSRLERLNTKIIEENDSYRSRLEVETDKQRQDLRDEFKRRTEELSGEFERKATDLTARESDLSRRSAELDDRSATHARRQIRQDLKKTIAERTSSFRLSGDTERKRLPIHFLFLSLVLASATLFVLALLGRLPSPSSIPLLSVVRLPIIAIALAGSIVFYIRWTDLWFRQNADEEMRLKRLELDIDRASWVVEMALEWKAAKGSEIPPELIDRLSKNLFGNESSRRARHPSEDLASALLSASTGLSVNIPGLGEARLDRKGVGNFKKALPESDTPGE